MTHRKQSKSEFLTPQTFVKAEAERYETRFRVRYIDPSFLDAPTRIGASKLSVQRNPLRKKSVLYTLSGRLPLSTRQSKQARPKKLRWDSGGYSYTEAQLRGRLLFKVSTQLAVPSVQESARTTISANTNSSNSRSQDLTILNR